MGWNRTIYQDFRRKASPGCLVQYHLNTLSRLCSGDYRVYHISCSGLRRGHSERCGKPVTIAIPDVTRARPARYPDIVIYPNDPPVTWELSVLRNGVPMDL